MQKDIDFSENIIYIQIINFRDVDCYRVYGQNLIYKANDAYFALFYRVFLMIWNVFTCLYHKKPCGQTIRSYARGTKNVLSKCEDGGDEEKRERQWQ